MSVLIKTPLPKREKFIHKRVGGPLSFSIGGTGCLACLRECANRDTELCGDACYHFSNFHSTDHAETEAKKQDA